MRGIGRIRAVSHQFQNRYEDWRRSQWQRRHNPSGQSTPVFLVGNGRSGTSMLVYHLTRSWHISLYNEDNPDAFESWFLRDFGTIDRLVAKENAPIVLLKPIKDTYRVRNLQEHYPDAKVLFAFRHFDDVINSSRKRFYVDYGRKIGKNVDEITPPVDRWMADDFGEYSDARPPVATRELIESLWHPHLNLFSKIALHWLFVNRLFFDLELDKDVRVLPIQYESLVSAPHASFQKICQFLQIPFTDEMLSDVFTSSISKTLPPELDSRVRAACEATWDDLCALVNQPTAVQPPAES